MSEIETISAQEVLDSRGFPTIEASVKTRAGATGSAKVPSGASTGEKEAVELRDGDNERFNGNGVLEAVSHIEGIVSEKLVGLDVRSQRKIDSVLLEADGTDNKRNLGANALLGVSLASAHAAAETTDQSLYRYLGGVNVNLLPLPFMNVINGGEHADNKLDFQEFMIVPGGASTYSEALRWGTEVFHALKSNLSENGYSTAVGDEGGFAPDVESNQEAIELLTESIDRAGYVPGDDIALALDVAASEIYENERYNLPGEGKRLNSESMVNYLSSFTEEYPIVSIEDGCDEEDWKGWKKLTDEIGDSVQVVGDDVFVTNPGILKKGIQEEIANSILIKVNQIGTLTETLNTVELAAKAGYTSMISHRSGETEDTTIADIAVALNTGQIKTGSLSRGERTAKYNRLLKIEKELGAQATFSGFDSLYGNFLD